jgi:hypothetical protein
MKIWTKMSEDDTGDQNKAKYGVVGELHGIVRLYDGELGSTRGRAFENDTKRPRKGRT